MEETGRRKKGLERKKEEEEEGKGSSRGEGGKEGINREKYSDEHNEVR